MSVWVIAYISASAFSAGTAATISHAQRVSWATGCYAPSRQPDFMETLASHDMHMPVTASRLDHVTAASPAHTHNHAVVQHPSVSGGQAGAAHSGPQPEGCTHST